MSNNDLSNLLSATDALVDEYLHPRAWFGTLPIPLNYCFICDKDVPLAMTSSASIDDLFEFCNGGKKSTWYSQNYVVRFNPEMYPVPSNGNNYFTSGSTGYKLITDLLDICHRKGRSTYCSNGSSTNCKNSRRIVCHHYLCYNKPKNDEEKVYKDLQLRKTNAKSTVPTSKRTMTGRAKSNEIRCGANFVIKVDEQSFYMTIGTGSGLHEYHAPHDVDSITLPQRLFPSEVAKNIQQLGFFNASNQTIIAMSRQQYNCNITRRQVSNLAAFGRMATSLQMVGDIPNGQNMSDPDQMIKYFESMKIPHIVLSHHKDIRHFEFQGESLRNRNKNNKGPVSEIEKENTINSVTDDAVNENGYVTMEHNGVNPTLLTNSESELDTSHINNMIEYGNDSRMALRVPNDQTVLLSFLWCVPHCRRLFQAYPEVLYIDGTHGTNRERMPLLTVDIRDETFSVIPVIRAFIPNERAWMFRWLFQYGIPTLMGKDACRKVKLIVTDGDSQETSQLDAAINAKIYGDSVRRRCGWHIIEKGTTFHLRFPSAKNSVQDIVAVMKLWVQESLMKDVETENEYKR
jgi:MULE transposase domain